MLVVKIAGGLVLVALIVAFLLRGRSSTPRTRTRGDFRPTLPPSPYKPSRGFRILDGSEVEEPHPVQRPRLDPNKEFVFNDPTALSAEPSALPHLRHDERWALDRSMRHAPHPHSRSRRRRAAWLILIAVLIAALVAAMLMGRHPPAHHAAFASYLVAPSSWMM